MGTIVSMASNVLGVIILLGISIILVFLSLALIIVSTILMVIDFICEEESNVKLNK